MLHIPDRISMDDLFKLWVAKALQAIQAENQVENQVETQPQPQPEDEQQDVG